MRLHSGIGSGSLAGVHPDSLVPAAVTIPRLAVQTGSLSDIEILRQLGGGTLRIDPFQQKSDADADENERPDPTRIDVDHAHSQQQEYDATDQE